MTSIEALAVRARRLVAAPGVRAVLGICGAPGSGKSTLAERLVAQLRADPPVGLGRDAVAHVPMDGFHLADAQLDRLGLRHAKGAPETFDAYGYLATLRRILAERDHPVYVPGFERDLEQPVAAALVVQDAVRLVVTEGNYLLLPDPPWPESRSLMAEVWYVDLDADVRLERLVTRHVEFGKSPEQAREWVLGSDEAKGPGSDGAPVLGLVVPVRGHEHQAAVDGIRRSGDVGGPRRGEEADHGRDLVDVAGAAECVRPPAASRTYGRTNDHHFAGMASLSTRARKVGGFWSFSGTATRKPRWDHGECVRCPSACPPVPWPSAQPSVVQRGRTRPIRAGSPPASG